MEKNNMFKKGILGTSAIAMVFMGATVTSFANAEQVPINGTVQSRCIIQTDTPGVYGNPNAYTLDTDPTQGGQLAVTRIDVTLANAYYAEITAPEEFSSSPNLPDVVTWTGNTEVKAVSDAENMGTYEADKIELGMTDKYDLTATGSTWFETTSQAVLGGNRAFPGGNYTALVQVECIAK
jgi:hypothetical protein